jgi:hypothetical protein
MPVCVPPALILRMITVKHAESRGIRELSYQRAEEGERLSVGPQIVAEVTPKADGTARTPLCRIVPTLVLSLSSNKSGIASVLKWGRAIRRFYSSRQISFFPSVLIVS